MATTNNIAKYGSLDDLLFRGKNKSYGAYKMRKEYEGRLQIAFILFLSILLGIILLINLIEKLKGRYIRYTNIESTKNIVDQTKLASYEVKKFLKETAKPTQSQKSNLNLTPSIVKSMPMQEPILRADIIENMDITAPMNNEGMQLNGMNEKSLSMGTENEAGLNLRYGYADAIDIAEVEPQFPGDLINFLQHRVTFPLICKELGYTQALVVVGFVVTEDGSIANIHLESSAHESFNEQALNAIRSMPKWMPGSNNGYKVKVNVSIPFHFVLED